MIVRSELTALLAGRLGDRLPQEEIAALAEEIDGLEAGWEEVRFDPRAMGYTMSVECEDICSLAEAIGKGQEVRFFRRRASA